MFRCWSASHAPSGDASKRNYTSAFNCFSRIAREEGYRAFYKVALLQSKGLSSTLVYAIITQGLGASYLGVAETAIQVKSPGIALQLTLLCLSASNLISSGSCFGGTRVVRILRQNVN